MRVRLRRSVKAGFHLRNADRDLDAPPIHFPRLSLHLAEAVQLARRSLSVRLRGRMKSAVEPPPFSTSRSSTRSFLKSLGHGVLRFHRHHMFVHVLFLFDTRRPQAPAHAPLPQRRVEQRHDRSGVAAPGGDSRQLLQRPQLRDHQALLRASLSLCPRTHSFRSADTDVLVFCFAERDHAEKFRDRFGGEFLDSKDRPKWPGS